MTNSLKINLQSVSVDLSIIIPVYNAEMTLRRCLDSIFCTSTLNSRFEVILVNDGSHDKSIEICREYKQKYPNIIKVIDQPNLGVSVARNVGIDNAQGKYILFEDSDDYFCPGILDNLELENSKADWELYNFEPKTKETIVNNKLVVAKDKIPYYEKVLYGDRSPKGVINTNYRVVWSKIYKRKIIVNNDIRFPVGIPIGEDMLFNIAYIAHSSIFRYHTAKMSVYCDNPGSAMRSDKEIEETIANNKAFTAGLKEYLNKLGITQVASWLYYDRVVLDSVEGYSISKKMVNGTDELILAVKFSSNSSKLKWRKEVAKRLSKKQFGVANLELAIISGIKKIKHLGYLRHADK